MVTGLCYSVSCYVLSFVEKEKIRELCLASSAHIIKYISISSWLAVPAGGREHGIVLRINRPFMAVAVAEWAVWHTCVVDKNWEGYLRSERCQAQERLHSSGF